MFKTRGGRGSKAVWTMLKKTDDLVLWVVPYVYQPFSPDKDNLYQTLKMNLLPIKFWKLPMVVHLFVGQETSIVWFGCCCKQVGATWKSLNYYRTATYYQTATDGLCIVWFQLCGTCDKFHNLWTKCLVEEIMTSLPILFSIHWQSHIVHVSGMIEICIILFDGGMGVEMSFGCRCRIIKSSEKGRQPSFHGLTFCFRAHKWLNIWSRQKKW